MQDAARPPRAISDPAPDASPKAAAALDEARITPMMAQYLGVKAGHPDCLLFYRMGDFYELFLEDAEIAARALNIVLTKRGKHEGADIPMCGVPVERSDDYLHRLIAQGHRVAICEQTEDPAEARKRGNRSVVRREVVRIVTPGTLTEDGLLEPGRANRLVTLTRVPAGEGTPLYGFAALDVSTGSFTVGDCDAPALPALLARLEPVEVVVPDSIADDPAVRAALESSRASVTPVAREFADAALADRRLRDWFGVETLDGFGSFSRAETAAAACAVAYVTRTQVGTRPQLRPPARLARGTTMEIDPATRANLELTRTLDGGKAGCLLTVLDQTVTAAGGRLLADQLAGPLTDVAGIAARLDGVAFAVADHPLRATLRGALKGTPDLMRALSRLALDRGGPRDLAAIRDGIRIGAALATRLARETDVPAGLAASAVAAGAVDPALADQLRRALADDLPLQRRDGRFIAPGYDSEVDEARLLRDDARVLVAGLQARYAESTGVRSLRLKHNNVLGFFIEVPQAQGEDWLRPPRDSVFIHRQTMAGAMRFSTTEIADLDGRIGAAAERMLARELALFDALREAVLEAAPAIRAAADGLAVLDVTLALGEVAATRGWTRPLVEDGLAFAIEGGRHPVVEAALRARGESFVANDCDLSGPEPRPGRARAGGRIAVVTGPNMAGKSTFLRQNAILAILAQMGSFVPARAARIGVVDRLFSRVGAADDLARGRSTFMVEMVEAAAILNQAGPRALVILDELGRGTATFDGLSIAWAAVEHLHDVNRARGLFATHFHELTRLSKRMSRLVNLTMRVTDWNGEVVFLHEVVPGAADRSYGIQVARLAGMPAPTIERARRLLAELEASARAAPMAPIDDLPLFAGHGPAAALTTTPLPPAPPDPALLALDALNPDELTPRGALEALYALKRARAPADRPA